VSVGSMMELCAEHRGEDLSIEFDDGKSGKRQVRMVYRLPLAEVVTDFFGKLKSRSSEQGPAAAGGSCLTRPWQAASRHLSTRTTATRHPTSSR
jgi:hypothetical protein